MGISSQWRRTQLRYGSMPCRSASLLRFGRRRDVSRHCDLSKRREFQLKTLQLPLVNRRREGSGSLATCVGTQFLLSFVKILIDGAIGQAEERRDFF